MAREPVSVRTCKTFRAEVGPRIPLRLAQEGHTPAQRLLGLAPGQAVHAEGAQAASKDGCVRLAAGDGHCPFGEHDSPQPASGPAPQGARRNVEHGFVEGADQMPRDLLQFVLRDVGGAEDAGGCRTARHLRHDKPRRLGQSVMGLQLRAAPIGQDIAARPAAAPGDPVGKAESQKRSGAQAVIVVRAAG